jgi:hypothetical protein|nr:MAG TPA: hypothetical protein [Herelleviridae sp.]
MKLQIEEAELRNLAHKASRYDIIMDALIREKFDKIDIYSDWEMTENYMQDIINQQPSDIKSVNEDKIKADREWMDKHPDFGTM